MAVQCLLSISSNLGGAGGLAAGDHILQASSGWMALTLAWSETEGHSQWGRVYAPAGGGAL